MSEKAYKAVLNKLYRHADSGKHPIKAVAWMTTYAKIEIHGWVVGHNYAGWLEEKGFYKDTTTMFERQRILIVLFSRYLYKPLSDYQKLLAYQHGKNRVNIVDPDFIAELLRRLKQADLNGEVISKEDMDELFAFYVLKS